MKPELLDYFLAADTLFEKLEEYCLDIEDNKAFLEFDKIVNKALELRDAIDEFGDRYEQ